MRALYKAAFALRELGEAPVVPVKSPDSNLRSRKFHHMGVERRNMKNPFFDPYKETSRHQFGC